MLDLHRYAWTAEGLRADLVRNKQDPRIVRAVHEDFSLFSFRKSAARRWKERIAKDAAYHGFLSRTLATVDISGDEVPEPSPRPVATTKTASQPAKPASAENDLSFLDGLFSGRVQSKQLRSVVAIMWLKSGDVDVQLAGIDPSAALRLLGMAEVQIERMKKANPKPRDEDEDEDEDEEEA